MNNLIKQIVESKFNFNIDIEGDDMNSLSKSKYTSKTLKLIYNDILFVDLNLPSGTLWCKYNLGVNPFELDVKENWYGDYYAWGELEGNKPEFNWDNYKFGKGYGELTKYCNNVNDGLNSFTDNLTELLPEDDVAYLNNKFYNHKFHIPTKEQFEELINCTKCYWINNYDPNKLVHNPKDDGGIQGLNGRIFVGKNENLMFIPAAGFCISSDIIYVNSCCYLWSSSLNLKRSYIAWRLSFNSDDINMNDSYRYRGCSIRPIINL